MRIDFVKSVDGELVRATTRTCATSPVQLSRKFTASVRLIQMPTNNKPSNIISFHHFFFGFAERSLTVFFRRAGINYWSIIAGITLFAKSTLASALPSGSSLSSYEYWLIGNNLIQRHYKDDVSNSENNLSYR